ncbi:MAG: protease inhibitor I42 family protein [Elusimicrobiales bacterium]|jgi:predicted secreted protein
MKKALFAAFFIASAGAAAIAQEPQGNPAMTATERTASYDETSNGGIIDAAVATVIEIRLPENASTGYAWIADGLDTEYLKIVSEDYDLNKGLHIFKVECLKSGKKDLKFNYLRPWENANTVNPIKKFRMTVEITIS